MNSMVADSCISAEIENILSVKMQLSTAFNSIKCSKLWWLIWLGSRLANTYLVVVANKLDQHWFLFPDVVVLHPGAEVGPVVHRAADTGAEVVRDRRQPDAWHHDRPLLARHAQRQEGGPGTNHIKLFCCNWWRQIVMEYFRLIEDNFAPWQIRS